MRAGRFSISRRRGGAFPLLVGLILSLRSGDALGVGFAPAVNYPVNLQPTAIAVGDWNRDGILDLAAETDGLGVWILLGRGDGTFQPAVGYSSSSGSSFSIGSADFNGDGKLDLVTSSYSSSNVSILLGNGDGTFQPPVDYPTGVNPIGVALGDFTGHGRTDLAVANFDPPSSISILAGNGDGTFQAPLDTPTVVTGPTGIAAGDLDGDGKLDLAVTSPSNAVAILFGNGDGTFAPELDLPVSGNPSAVAIGDINGDGIPDLVVANGGTNDIAVLLGMGNRTFGAPTRYATGANPVSPAFADFDGDGRRDVAIANNNSNSVSVFPGNGDGTLQPRSDFGTPFNPSALSVGDFNRDGRPDLAVTNYGGGNVSILLNDTPRVTAPVPGIGPLASVLLALFLATTGLAALRRSA